MIVISKIGYQEISDFTGQKMYKVMTNNKKEGWKKWIVMQM